MRLEEIAGAACTRYTSAPPRARRTACTGDEEIYIDSHRARAIDIFQRGQGYLMAKKKVFIVDDHPVVRQGLAAFINGEDDFIVCGDAEDADGAIRLHQ